MSSPIGSAVPGLEWELRNQDGTLVDSDVTLKVFVPENEGPIQVANYRVTTGVYTARYVPLRSGRYTYIWSAQGAYESRYEGTFVVDETPHGSLVALDDAIAHLNAGRLFEDPGRRQQLLSLCLAATRACESYVRKPLAVREFTETLSGSTVGRSGIYLKRRPLVEVRSVSDGLAALTPGEFQVDEAAGVVYRGAPFYLGGPGQQAWSPGFRNVTVTYIAGYPDPPADVRLAVLREVEHLWQRTQNAPHPGMGGEAYDEMLRDAQSAMPWPVRYLLDPYVDVGGFA